MQKKGFKTDLPIKIKKGISLQIYFQILERAWLRA